jgi:hypothetical protein
MGGAVGVNVKEKLGLVHIMGQCMSHLTTGYRNPTALNYHIVTFCPFSEHGMASQTPYVRKVFHTPM